MSLVLGPADYIVMKPEERSNSKVKASVSYSVKPPTRGLTRFPWGKPCTATYYEITYRVLKRDDFPFLGGVIKVPNHIIVYLLTTTLNVIITGLSNHEFMKEANAPPSTIDYDYEETNQLSNI